MRLKLVFAITVLLAVLPNRPCFAKDGHGQRGAGASAANNGAIGKGANAKGASAKGTGRSNSASAPNGADVPIDGGVTVAPPVLPPHSVTRHQIRIVNPSGKTPANPVNRAALGSTTAPMTRNAIGQPVVPPRNFVGAPPTVPALQKPGVGLPPIIHGALGVPNAPPVVSSGTARVNVANATNRSINDTTVVHPATAPSAIGGPASGRYGINGTTVRNRH